MKSVKDRIDLDSLIYNRICKRVDDEVKHYVDCLLDYKSPRKMFWKLEFELTEEIRIVSNKKKIK